MIPSLHGASGPLRVLALEKLITIYHANHYVAEFLPAATAQ